MTGDDSMQGHYRDAVGEDEYGPPEYGVRSSDIGSFLPEGSYRPLPIVWLAGAWFSQYLSLCVLWLLLLGKHPAFFMATAAILSFGIGRWTWGRGMGEAGTGWQVLTIVALVFGWGVFCIITLAGWSLGVT